MYLYCIVNKILQVYIYLSIIYKLICIYCLLFGYLSLESVLGDKQIYKTYKKYTLLNLDDFFRRIKVYLSVYFNSVGKPA